MSVSHHLIRLSFNHTHTITHTNTHIHKNTHKYTHTLTIHTHKYPIILNFEIFLQYFYFEYFSIVSFMDIKDKSVTSINFEIYIYIVYNPLKNTKYKRFFWKYYRSKLAFVVLLAFELQCHKRNSPKLFILSQFFKCFFKLKSIRKFK